METSTQTGNKNIEINHIKFYHISCMTVHFLQTETHHLDPSIPIYIFLENVTTSILLLKKYTLIKWMNGFKETFPLKDIKKISPVIINENN